MDDDRRLWSVAGISLDRPELRTGGVEPSLQRCPASAVAWLSFLTAPYSRRKGPLLAS